MRLDGRLLTEKPWETQYLSERNARPKWAHLTFQYERRKGNKFSDLSLEEACLSSKIKSDNEQHCHDAQNIFPSTG